MFGNKLIRTGVGASALLTGGGGGGSLTLTYEGKIEQADGVYNGAQTVSGTPTADGKFHIFIWYWRDNGTNGRPTSPAVGGVSLNVVNDGVADAETDGANNGNITIMVSSGPISGTSNDWTFTNPAFYAEGEMAVYSCSVQPAVDTVANTSFAANGNPLVCDVNTSANGAVVSGMHVANAFTAAVGSGITLDSATDGTEVHNGEEVLWGHANNTTAETPRSMDVTITYTAGAGQTSITSASFTAA